MKRFFALLVLLPVHATLAGDSPRALSLREAREQVLKRHPRITAADQRASK
jgi:hypothetical protein